MDDYGKTMGWYMVLPYMSEDSKNSIVTKWAIEILVDRGDLDKYSKTVDKYSKTMYKYGKTVDS